MQRLIEARTTRWTERYYRGEESQLERAVKKHVDAVIEKEVKETRLNFGDIQKRAAEKLDEQDVILKDLLTKEVERIDIKHMVNELVKEDVRRLCKHSIDESTVALVQQLSAHIKELERENATLKASIEEYRRTSA